MEEWEKVLEKIHYIEWKEKEENRRNKLWERKRRELENEKKWEFKIASKKEVKTRGTTKVTGMRNARFILNFQME